MRVTKRIARAFIHPTVNTETSLLLACVLHGHPTRWMPLLFKTEGAVSSFSSHKEPRLRIGAKSPLLLSPQKMKHWSAPTVNGIFPFPFVFCLFFPSSPQDGCVHQRSSPGSTHSTLHPASPRRKGHVLDWGATEGQAGGTVGQKGAVFADDQWALRARPTWHQQQSPPLGSGGWHCSKKGFWTLFLTSPLQLQVQSPGNSLRQLAARAVCT